MDYKGALQGDDAHAVWIGDVLIRAEATGTDTYERNRNLVLTDGARVDSVPNLEILTGEVVGAGHASTSGRLEDQHLFYLMARGIPVDEARRLVIRGFFGELVGQDRGARAAGRGSPRRSRPSWRAAMTEAAAGHEFVAGLRAGRRCPPRARSGCEIGDVPVAVVRAGGEVFALHDVCSHEEVPLSEGEVYDHTVECWLHGSCFDLRTGEPTGPPGHRAGADLPGEDRRRRRVCRHSDRYCG